MLTKRQQLQTAPWLMFFPGLAIFVTVVVFNLWGDICVMCLTRVVMLKIKAYLVKL